VACGLSSLASTFTAFADSGPYSLSRFALQSALETLDVGLSETEAAFVASSLASDPATQISISQLESAFAAAEASQEARQLASWARQVLEPFRPVVGVHLRAQDARQTGLLSSAEFQRALAELLPDITPAQLDILALLADKNTQGEIDYVKFADSCSGPLYPPPAPPSAPQQSEFQTIHTTDWGSVLEPATFGETENWAFQTCTSQDFAAPST